MNPRLRHRSLRHERRCPLLENHQRRPILGRRGESCAAIGDRPDGSSLPGGQGGLKRNGLRPGRFSPKVFSRWSPGWGLWSRKRAGDHGEGGAETIGTDGHEARSRKLTSPRGLMNRTFSGASWPWPSCQMTCARARGGVLEAWRNRARQAAVKSAAARGAPIWCCASRTARRSSSGPSRQTPRRRKRTAISKMPCFCLQRQRDDIGDQRDQRR